MNLLPRASGNRPRLACEISPQGVVAARVELAGASITAVSRVGLATGAVLPSLRPGNLVDRVAVIAAVRKALEDVGARGNSRGSNLTLVIPDAAVRVLLLDFDALPNRLSEALPIVRFRLKKMLPFDADGAMVTYQVMSTGRGLVRVLAVAIPPDVLLEYESVAREAGFEPGAVLPSTLACVAGVEETEGPALLINANPVGITTAIVRSGILLLHRSVDLQPHVGGVPANFPPALFESNGHALPLIDIHDSAGEWAAQEALPEHGHNPYADVATVISERDARTWEVSSSQPVSEPSEDISTEIAQAVSVAAAYYEDTLAASPTRILCAGPLGADALQNILTRNGLAQADGLRVREVVNSAALSGAVAASVPRGWLAAVAGALTA